MPRLCGSNKLCISDVPFQLEKGNFDPPQLPHFRPILMKPKTKKHVRGVDPHTKLGKDRPIGRVWENTRILAVHSHLPVIFLYSSLRVPVLLQPTNEGSKRVFSAKRVPFGNFNNKNNI